MSEGYQRYRVLWPLVPAMAMVMIDFTIVSISATTIQRDVHLTEMGQEWLGMLPSGAVGVNTNPGNSTDAEIEAVGASGVSVFAQGGNDLVTGLGGPGFAGPLRGA